MHYSVLMRVVNRPGQRLEQLGCLPRRLRRAVEPGRKAFAFDELQRQERTALVFTDLIDLHDVGVLEFGLRPGLGPEPGSFSLPGELSRQDHLERDDAAEANLFQYSSCT